MQDTRYAGGLRGPSRRFLGVQQTNQNPEVAFFLPCSVSTLDCAHPIREVQERGGANMRLLHLDSDELMSMTCSA